MKAASKQNENPFRERAVVASRLAMALYAKGHPDIATVNPEAGRLGSTRQSLVEKG
jgi:hypothetical protein